MIIVKGVIAIVALLIIPELLGLLILKFLKKQKNNIILAFVLGYVIEFAIAQLVTVPSIFAEISLKNLVHLYTAIICTLSIISIIINRLRFLDILKETKENIKELPKNLTILVAVLIILQLFVFVKYVHIDNDDATYVATATTAVQTDTLFKYSAQIGTSEPYEQSLVRYRLGPFPIFYAILSVILNIHPAIVAHTVLPLIFVPIVYMVYWLIANELFKEDKKSAVLFMLFICILHVFSFYSGKNNFIFVLFRIWQGKAMLANFIIPVVLLLFIYAEKENFKIINLITLFLIILAGNFTTTMAIGLPPIALMLMAFCYESVKLISKEIEVKKALLNFGKCLICCIPSIIYGVIYFIK